MKTHEYRTAGRGDWWPITENEALKIISGYGENNDDFLLRQIAKGRTVSVAPYELRKIKSGGNPL